MHQIHIYCTTTPQVCHVNTLMCMSLIESLKQNNNQVHSCSLFLEFIVTEHAVAVISDRPTNRD
jgi:hypothetical protein